MVPGEWGGASQNDLGLVGFVWPDHGLIFFSVGQSLASCFLRDWKQPLGLSEGWAWPLPTLASWCPLVSVHMSPVSFLLVSSLIDCSKL